MAHRISATLQPQSVGDPRWIESAILPIVKRCLEINIREKRYNIANELLGYIDAYVQCLAEEQQIKFAFDLIRQTFSSCENFIFVKEDKTLVEEPLEHMGICERLAKMPISALVSYSRAVDAYGRDMILQRIRRIVWKSKKSIYRAGFAVHALKQLEWLQPRIEFEERVEGHPISPPWYLQELVAQTESENLATTLISFHDEACSLYEHWIKAAKSSQRPWLTAVVISRESEYWHKLHYHENVLTQLWDDLNSQRRIEGLSWSSLEMDSLIQKREQRQTELLRTISAHNALSLISRPKGFPDFAGQFLHTTGEALLLAVCENKRDGIEEISETILMEAFWSITDSGQREKD